MQSFFCRFAVLANASLLRSSSSQPGQVSPPSAFHLSPASRRHGSDRVSWTAQNRLHNPNDLVGVQRSPCRIAASLKPQQQKPAFVEKASRRGTSPPTERDRKVPATSIGKVAREPKPIRPLSRNQVLGSAALVAGASLLTKFAGSQGGDVSEEAARSASKQIAQKVGSKGGYLGWRRLSEAESRRKALQAQNTYPVRFVTYLTRFLISYDPDDHFFWGRLATEVPFTYTPEQVQVMRRSQFASLAESVQVGLADYQGEQGIDRLFDTLRQRYGRTVEQRRQLAFLFTFLDQKQPTLRIAKHLADTDSASVTSFRLLAGGDGYTQAEAPRVVITSPMMATPQPAAARAVLRDLGTIRRIQVLDKGCIYVQGVPPEVVISAPPPGSGGRRARGMALLDGNGGIKEVVVTDPGAGYRSNRPIKVDFIAKGLGEAEEGLRLAAGALEGGCSGPARAAGVVDREVGRIDLLDGGVGYVVPIGAQVEIEEPAEIGGRQARASAVVKPTVPASSVPSKYTPSSFSAMLQELLPSDTALFFDPERKIFVLGGAIEDELEEYRPKDTMSDPVFGSVGRSPIETETDLTLESYIRLGLSGGFCISIVRTILQPFEILKTRMQARPDLYPGILQGVKRIQEEGGKNAFYPAWECTSLAGFLLGVFGFGFNEWLRRLLIEWVGPGISEVFNVPIILVASAFSTLLTALLTCPLEAVRIRTMSVPAEMPFGGFVGVGADMLQTMGWGGLYDGLEPLLFREVPFIMTKFLVFDFVRSALSHLFPAAQDSATVSLIISFVAGVTAGVAGAFTGCPADAVLVRVNAYGREVDWREMVKMMLKGPGGWRNLFAGVNVRVFFFAFLIGMQFFLYDWFKGLFGVAADDLNLVLDVFSSPSSTAVPPPIS